MFTGIIQATTKILKLKRSAGGLLLTVKKPKGWRITAGESIAIDGICSTVKSLQGGLVFEYMPETLSITSADNFKVGAAVNMERSLRVSDLLSGHIVTGHVDATGTINLIKREGNSKVLSITLPKEIKKLIAKKGSVALNGISLTVAGVGADVFSIKIIPYTIRHTNLRFKKIGDKVNIEGDILAKYIQRLMKK